MLKILDRIENEFMLKAMSLKVEEYVLGELD